jgi:hypothetical protein
MSHMCNEATHIHGNRLDLVLWSNPDNLLHLKVDPITCATKSDHYCITFNIPQHPTHHSTEHPQNNLFTPKLTLPDYLPHQPTASGTCHQLSLEVCLSYDHIWKKNLRSLQPAYPHCQNILKVWFTPQIRYKIIGTRILRHSIKCKPASQKLAKLAQLEQDHLIQTSIRSYESELIRSHHHNPKNFFRHLKSLSNGKSPIPIIMPNSQVIHKPTE